MRAPSKASAAWCHRIPGGCPVVFAKTHTPWVKLASIHSTCTWMTPQGSLRPRPYRASACGCPGCEAHLQSVLPGVTPELGGGPPAEDAHKGAAGRVTSPANRLLDLGPQRRGPRRLDHRALVTKSVVRALPSRWQPAKQLLLV